MASPYPTSVELEATAGRSVLFLDLLEVAEMQRVHQVVRPAIKHPSNPVIRTGPLGTWDSLQASPWQGTVMWDAEDGHYKAWYMGMDVAEAGLQIPRVGYAVSPDGSTWEKPNVGVHEYGGSRDNNLIAFLPGRRTNGPALKDPGEIDPSRRYKLLLRDENGDREIWNSPDGLGFTREGAPSISTPPAADGSRRQLPDPLAWFDAHQLLYDRQDPNPDRRYKAYGQMSARRGGWSIRKGALLYGPDPWTWTRSPQNPVIDPDEGDESQIHFISVLPYKGLYVMLYEYGWLDPLTSVYVADIRLAVSRDGERFQRVQPNQPFVRRGGPGDWDGGFLVTSSDLVVRDHEIQVFYAGQPEHWTNWPSENRGEWTSSAGSVYPAQTGLATIPLDGFAALETADGEMPGAVTTIPLKPSATRVGLEISWGNALPGRNWIDVQVVDLAGDPISTVSPARVVTQGSCVPVVWDDLHSLPVDREFRLRFGIHGAARLFGFSFRDIDGRQ